MAAKIHVPHDQRCPSSFPVVVRKDRRFSGETSLHSRGRFHGHHVCKAHDPIL
nr:MAG TPA: hypothetical protein [Bacteriophage sp.]